jgi:hypothetical protein
MKEINSKALLLFFIFAAMFVSGCATTKPKQTNKGSLIRVTDRTEEVKDCKYVGQVNSFYASSAGTMSNYNFFLDELKNRAAAMGGNVLLTKGLLMTVTQSTLIGDAYHCQNHSRPDTEKTTSPTP